MAGALVHITVRIGYPKALKTLSHLRKPTIMLQAIKSSSPGVLISRMLVSALAVFGTYNPTGKSVFHWIKAQNDYSNAWVILVAIIAILVNFALLVAAWKALGKLGTIVLLILFAALVYLALQENWVSEKSPVTLQWLALILYSGFLGIGLSGAILWRRATGQVVTDEAPDVQD